MIYQIKKKVEIFYENLIRDHRSKAQAIYDNRNLSHCLKDSEPLTKYEKKEISDRWGKVINCVPRGFDFFRGIKSLRGFDSSYVPSSYFFPYIENVLNPEPWKRQLGHKGLTELMYGAGIKYPLTLIRSYGGELFNEKFRPIDCNDAISIIEKHGQPLIYKPAIDSEQGSGVKMFFPSEFNDLCRDIRTGAIFKKCADFVLQQPVAQCSDTLKLNPSSLNCMRITTLNLNNEITVGSMAIKCGPKNSVVDNIGSGKRGVIVGLHQDGSLNDYGFYGNGEKAYQHNDVVFKGKKINNFQSVVDAAIKLHEHVRSCKIIGWDIALDSEYLPVLIEGNTNYPGISFEQMCSGPIFGDRTDEVIRHLIKDGR